MNTGDCLPYEREGCVTKAPKVPPCGSAIFSEIAGAFGPDMPKESGDIMSGLLSDSFRPFSIAIGQETSFHLLLKEPPFGTVTYYFALLSHFVLRSRRG